MHSLVAPLAGSPPEGVRRLDGSAEARDLSALPRVDYQDAFELELGPGASTRRAEGWIREMIEGASAGQRRRLVAGWTALGLRLERDDPASVLGWRVQRAEATAVVLAAESRVGMPAELILLRGADRLTFSTLIRFGNPAVRAIWAAVEPVHLRVVADLLARVGRA